MQPDFIDTRQRESRQSCI